MIVTRSRFFSLSKLLKHPSESYYAINVINVLDYIDYENAEPNDWGGFDKWTFIEEIIENQHIF